MSQTGFDGHTHIIGNELKGVPYIDPSPPAQAKALIAMGQPDPKAASMKASERCLKASHRAAVGEIEGFAGSKSCEESV